MKKILRGTTCRTYNSVVVLGRAMEDPKMTEDPAYGPHTTFSLVSERKTGIGREPVTVRIEARRRLAELCVEIIKKGREVLIVGQLGRKEKTGVLVHASEIKFLGGDR